MSENLATETVSHVLVPKYIKMTTVKEKEKKNYTLYKCTGKSPSISLRCRLNLYCQFCHDFYEVENNAREQ